MRRVRSLWPVALLLAAGIRVPGQDSSRTTIQARAEEVTLDIVARDKKGHMVSDLQPGDLKIADQGLPVKLTSLHFHQVGQQAQTARRVALLFEGLPGDAAKLARDAAAGIVREAGDDVDFTVLVVTTRMRLVETFTRDRNLLNRAIGEATQVGKTKNNLGYDTPENALRVLASDASRGVSTRDQNDVSESSETPSQMARVMLNALGASQEYALAQNAMPALGALLALSQQLGALPGRKSIVYFSTALQTDSRSRAFLDRVADAANRNNVRISAFDVSGVSIWARTQSSRILTAGEASVRNSDNSPPTQLHSGNLDGLNIQERTLISGPGPSGLRDLAARTGGFFVENSNDLRKAGRRFVDELNSYYEATFVPAPHADSEQLHAIDVKTTRRGIRIQARTAYATQVPPLEVTEAFERPLLEAISATPLPGDLVVHAALVSLGYEQPDQVAVSLAVEVPLQDMVFEEQADSKLFGMHFTVLARVRDKNGAIIRKFSRDVPYRGALDLEGRARQDVYGFTGRFSIAPGEYTVEAAVVDRNSGRAGARRDQVTVDVPPPGYWMSDLSLVRRLEPTAGGEGASDPYRYRNATVVPDLTREFDRRRDAPLWIFFLTNRVTGPTGVPKVSLEVRRDRQLLAASALTPSDDTGSSVIPYLASISPKNLEPGRYELRVLLEKAGPAGGKSVFFDVIGPPLVEETAALSEGDSVAREEGLSATLAEPAVVEGATGAAGGPVPALSEQQRTLEGARQRALAFTGSLPNFSCIESTRRYVSPDGTRWRNRDSFTELLEFVDGEERRTTLEVDGQRSQMLRSEIEGAASAGEYGSILRAVFGAEAAAAFEWKEWSLRNGRTLAVFSYRIDVAHSRYAMRVGARTVNAGAHGLVYIDPMTLTVHRIAMVADQIPPRFPYRESSIAVDYEFVNIGDGDYALPVEAEVQIRRASGSYQKNQLTFRDYKRFGAKSSVTFQEK